MIMADNFSHSSLGIRVAEYLKEDIFLENIKPGERIVESQLAEKLNISRAPVREAIKELENQGLIVSVPRKGSFVVEFTQEDIEELLDIRVLLEDKIIEKLIRDRVLKETDYIKLTSIIDEMVVQAAKNKDNNIRILNFNKKDMAFHQYLWEKAGCKWTRKILSNLYFQLKLAMVIDSKREGDLVEAAKQHYEILNCLKKSDRQKAIQAVIDHIVTFKGK